MNTNLDRLRTALHGLTYGELMDLISDYFDKPELIDLLMNLDARAIDELYKDFVGTEEGDIRQETQRQKLLDQLERSLSNRTGGHP